MANFGNAGAPALDPAGQSLSDAELARRLLLARGAIAELGPTFDLERNPLSGIYSARSPMDERPPQPAATGGAISEDLYRGRTALPATRRGAIFAGPEVPERPTRAIAAPRNLSPARAATPAISEQPLSPDELAAEGRPAFAQYERDAASRPQPQQAKKLGGFANVMGNVGAIVADLVDPAAGALIYRAATNAGRQAATRERNQAAEQDWQNRISSDLTAANAEQAAIPPQPKPVDYQFKTIGGHLWSVDPSTGRKTRDLGAVGTANVKQVTADGQGNAIAVMSDGTVKPLGYKAQAKQRTFSNPFEAFAYGTPDEKQAAQNFVNFERRSGARYRNPTDLEEKYRLYKTDPKAYEAMFGTKGGGISQSTATRMLNYFDRRRRDIENDYTLSDQERKQKLAEVQMLEQPFMAAARGQSNAGARGETITVINPQGQLGTIPLGNLKKALARGYKVASQQ